MSIPTIRTAGLDLVAPSAECWGAYERFYTSAEASRAYGGPLSVGAAWSRLSSDLGSWYLQGFGVWAIQRQDDGGFVGTCGFWRGKGWPRELTWWLLPEARGGGIATEASRAAIDHAYRVFRWDSVETYMNDDNQPARALAIRLGGQRVDRRLFPDGKERDVFLLPPAVGSK
ncbi:MAG: GNAT family N-acetyltransferase [Xanthomonadales bacterium]|nr:GNAT family N-acetyltransferase [Xanthomonadales bacterium]